MKLIREFLKYIRMLREMESANRKNQGKYLLNCFSDAQMLQDACEAASRDKDLVITFQTLDGIRLTIKKNKYTEQRTNKWQLRNIAL